MSLPTPPDPTVTSVPEPDQPLVLVAEDHELNRTILADYLQANGLQVITAVHGGEALHSAQSLAPDIILLDLQLPVLDGLSVIQQLRAQGNTTPILVITGMVSPDDARRSLQAGATAYLSKPFQLQALLKQIRQILDERARSA